MGFCISCGTKLPENAVFCTICGKKVYVPPVPAPVTAEAPAQQEDTAPLEPVTQIPTEQPIAEEACIPATEDTPAKEAAPIVPEAPAPEQPADVEPEAVAEPEPQTETVSPEAVTPEAEPETEADQPQAAAAEPAQPQAEAVQSTQPQTAAAAPQPATQQNIWFSPVSSWRFFGAFLLMNVPLVGLIFAIIWACGACKRVNLQNFARAMLLLKGLSILLYCVLVIIFVWLTAAFGGELRFLLFRLMAQLLGLA